MTKRAKKRIIKSWLRREMIGFGKAAVGAAGDMAQSFHDEAAFAITGRSASKKKRK